MTPFRTIPTLYVQLGIAILMLVACGVCYWNSISQHENPDAPLQAIRDVQQLETQWNAQVMLAAFGYNRNYDTINSAYDALSRAIQHAGLAGSAKTGVQTSAAAAYLAHLDEKRQLAERMKSARAVLQNSASYLPLALKQLEDSLWANDAAVAGGAANLITRVGNVTSGMIAYQAQPLPGAAQALRQQVGALAAANVVGDAAGDLALFISHVDVLLRSTDVLSFSAHSFSNILSGPALQRVLNEREKQRQENANQQQMQLLWSIILGGIGLALLTYVIVHGARRNRSLSQSNAELIISKAEAETQLIQAAKMSAIGQMVAGIVHEINTPLAYVKATFEFLNDQIIDVPDILGPAADRRAHLTDEDPQEARRAYIDDIQTLLADGIHGIDQISKLILSLKNFSRLDHGKLSEFSVEEGLTSSLYIARYSLKNVADVHTDFGNVPRITGSPSHINQVFLNIIMNAAQAMQPMAKRGRLDITTRMAGDNLIAIVIRDNGPGIPEDVLPRIFDLYFTTKPQGEGSGVGLAICYRIIKNHDGRIEVTSVVGSGTTFSIYLPVRTRQNSGTTDAESNTSFPPSADAAHSIDHNPFPAANPS
ncbi:hypothetical protein GCM10027287_41880 [Bordetella muralis]